MDKITKTTLDFSPTTTKIILAEASFYSFIYPRAKARGNKQVTFRPLSFDYAQNEGSGRQAQCDKGFNLF